MTTIRRTCFHKGQDCQGTCVKASIWPTDQVQISCTNLKIAEIPCCRNCNSWLKNCCIWCPPIAGYSKREHRRQRLDHRHRSTSVNHKPASETTHEQARQRQSPTVTRTARHWLAIFLACAMDPAATRPSAEP